MSHCERVGEYAAHLGETLQLPACQISALWTGGIVHDIGKIVVPVEILLKPGPLTPEEAKIVEQHPAVGVQICAPLESFRDVLPIIRHHHERLDGSGYPDGLRGDCIPLTARILQIADIFDALITDRPYRRALSREEAFRVLREEAAKGWRDAELIDQLESFVLPDRDTGCEDQLAPASGIFQDRRARAYLTGFEQGEAPGFYTRDL